MQIHIIGGGEVGQCYARSLSSAGYQVASLYDTRASAALDAVAREVGATVRVASYDGLAQADLVISAVFGAAALDLAQQVIPVMRPGAYYADFTTASSAHMRQANALASRHAVRFIDVAIMGAIRLTAGKTPLLCAGADCQALADMLQTAGAPVKVVGGTPGDAASLKLMRSILTKGIEALAVECLVAAQRRGLRDSLYDVLSDIDSMPLRTLMEACVQSHVQHAPRRLVEVQEAKRQLRSEHLQPLALDGIEALFQRTTNALAHGAPCADTLDDSLDWLGELAATPEVR